MEARLTHLEDRVQFMETVLAENIDSVSQITAQLAEISTQLENISQITAHLNQLTTQVAHLNQLATQVANLAEKLDPESLKRELCDSDQD